jgi:hypothetical protein
LPDELLSLKPFGLTTYHAYTQKNSDDSVTHAQLIWKEHEVHAAHKKMLETTVSPDPARAPVLPTSTPPVDYEFCHHKEFLPLPVITTIVGVIERRRSAAGCKRKPGSRSLLKICVLGGRKHPDGGDANPRAVAIRSFDFNAIHGLDVFDSDGVVCKVETTGCESFAMGPTFSGNVCAACKNPRGFNDGICGCGDDRVVYQHQAKVATSADGSPKVSTAGMASTCSWSIVEDFESLDRHAMCQHDVDQKHLGDEEDWPVSAAPELEIHMPTDPNERTWSKWSKLEAQAGGAASAAQQLAEPADPEHADYVLIGSGEHPPNRLSGRMKHNVEEMRKQAPTDPMHVMKGTGKVAATKLDETTSLAGTASIKSQRVAPPTNLTHVMKGTGKVAATKLDETTSLGGTASIKSQRVAPPTNPMHTMKGTGKVAVTKLDETTSLGGTAGGPIVGRHCPHGIDGQPSMRFTNPTNGLVFSHSTVRAPESMLVHWRAGSMTMTSSASALDLLQPSASTLRTMNLRTCSQIEDAELMAMIISALGSGVRSTRAFAEVYSATEGSLRSWVGRNGGPSWKELKKLHPLTAPKKNKKRKAAAKTGEKQTKKRK